MRAKELRNPAVLIATGFGVGLVPRAPGTFGTLLAIPLWWVLYGTGPALYLGLAAVGFAAGILVCHRATVVLGEHDHPGIVIDEVAGYFTALAVVPLKLYWLVLSFFVFRMFDILKPWPIGWLDRRIGGGLGIMLDDMVAGALTAGVMLAAMRWAL